MVFRNPWYRNKRIKNLWRIDKDTGWFIHYADEHQRKVFNQVIVYSDFILRELFYF